MPARFTEVNITGQEGGRNNYSNGSGSFRENDVIVSGLSARLPESSNVEEFKKNLFGGVDLVTDDERRWPAGM